MRRAGRRGAEAAPMRYRSYYGLWGGVCSNRLDEARKICEAAVREEFYNPDLHWNLGRVYLRAGNRLKAFGSFVRGLQLNPRHAGLVGEIRRLGIRKRPVVRFFPRGHPVNRILGRLRGHLARTASDPRRQTSVTGR